MIWNGGDAVAREMDGATVLYSERRHVGRNPLAKARFILPGGSRREPKRNVSCPEVYTAKGPDGYEKSNQRRV